MDRAAVRRHARDAAEGERACHPELCRGVGDLAEDRAPTQRRLGPAAEHDVATGPPGDEVDRRPHDLACDAAREPHGRTRLLEVHEVGEVDGREPATGLDLLGEDRHRPLTRHARVDPSRQRDHEDRVAQRRPVVDVEERCHRDHTRGEGRDRVGSGSVRFGVHTGVHNTSTDELEALWKRIEGHGFDWISIWDHFYAADATITREGTSSGSHCLEAITAHTALVMTTSTVRCGSLVYCVGYRHPAVLANAMATLDHLAGGRVTFGLGAGWHQAEYAAYGIPFPPAPVRLRQVREAIQCVRLLLTEDVANFDGEFFQLHDARCDPKPVQPRLPLWLGGGGEKVTLKLVAQHADGWNVPFVTPEQYAHKMSVLHQHCEQVGRDPGEIDCTVNLALGVARGRPRGTVRRARGRGTPERVERDRPAGDRPGRRVLRRWMRAGEPRDARAVRRRRPRPVRERGAPRVRVTAADQPRPKPPPNQLPPSSRGRNARWKSVPAKSGGTSPVVAKRYSAVR